MENKTLILPEYRIQDFFGKDILITPDNKNGLDAVIKTFEENDWKEYFLSLKDVETSFNVGKVHKIYPPEREEIDISLSYRILHLLKENCKRKTISLSSPPELVEPLINTAYNYESLRKDFRFYERFPPVLIRFSRESIEAIVENLKIDPDELLRYS